MQKLGHKTIKTECHPEVKRLFLFVFAGTRRSIARHKIVQIIRNNPLNIHQISKEVGIDYKAIQHHIKVLEKNNLISKVGDTYAVMYFLAPLLESNLEVFDEIVSKMEKSSRWVLREKPRI